jgi:hypothetical protein
MVMQQSEEAIRIRQVRKACVAAIKPMFGVEEEDEEDTSFATRTIDYAS